MAARLEAVPFQKRTGSCFCDLALQKFSSTSRTPRASLKATLFSPSKVEGMTPAQTTHNAPTVNPWLIALAVMLATFMEVLDTSIAAVALPYIAGSLSEIGRASCRYTV